MRDQFGAELGSDPMPDEGLFEMAPPPPVSLADRFGIPPFSVLHRRGGQWQERRARWLAMGIQSELGRDVRTYAKNAGDDEVTKKIESYGTVSIFDPVLCELVYRWFTPPGATILDPFAGGSVRGVVASTLARWYYGIDLRAEQVAANLAQLHLCTDVTPNWMTGDARKLDELGTLGDFDMIFTCPPYADLEVYSDDPADLSNMPYPQFLAAYREIIADVVPRLRPNRFAAWVVSDIRDRRGCYRGLVGETVAAFTNAGMHLYNDAVILDPIASTAIRAGQSFTATRKLARCHQHLLVFVKGDPKQAAIYAMGGLR